MTWTVAIDIGGTFTDVVADDEAGRRLTAKVPTVPADPALGLLTALSELGRQGLAFDDVALVFHGTTIATNAVINDRLARVVLLTTKGFRDILTYRSGPVPTRTTFARAVPGSSSRAVTGSRWTKGSAERASSRPSLLRKSTGPPTR